MEEVLAFKADLSFGSATSDLWVPQASTVVQLWLADGETFEGQGA